MKLDTEHLMKELTKILDEEGLSPDELAVESGISKVTVYRILRLYKPTTQRAIGRKIAGGTSRDFRIEGDKIYFTKKEVNTAANSLQKKHELVENTLGIENYFDESTPPEKIFQYDNLKASSKTSKILNNLSEEEEHLLKLYRKATTEVKLAIDLILKNPSSQKQSQ